MVRLYLISTSHLEDRLLFMNEEDFRVAMNHIAIQAALCPEVVVLAFILMSNHVHFILKGTEKEVIAFVNGFKQRYSMYYFKTHGVKSLLHRNALDIRCLSNEYEAVERAIAYVQMNCVAANICSHPVQYPWGTGNTFFNTAGVNGKRADEISLRSWKSLSHSYWTDIPGNWILDEKGFIHPASYVDVKTVESIFRSPKRMLYFYNNSSKAKKRIGLSEDGIPAFRDHSILATLPDLFRSLFQKGSFEELNSEEKKECTRQIRYRFSADAHQIARVCGITYAEAAKLLESI